MLEDRVEIVNAKSPPSKQKILLQSRTRLYTNFYIGEHKEDYVVTSCKQAIRTLFESLSSVLDDDSFLEGIFAGADIAMLGFYPNIETSKKVNAKIIGGQYIKWLKSVFQNPSRYMKLVYIVEDVDGSLAIDFLMSINVGDDKYSGLVSGDAEVISNRFDALYNTLTAAKYRIFKKLQSILAAKPGLNIEDICDVYTVEHVSQKDSSDIRKLSKIVRPVNSLDNVVKTIWSAKLSVFIP